MPTTRRTFTRRELTARLGEAGRAALAELIYSRRLDVADGGGRALAIDFDTPAELAEFVAVMTSVTGGGLEFAASTRFGLPGHPGGCASSGAHWPGWVLAEPTVEQWWDAVSGCAACTALEDEHCPAHTRAPWEPTAPALVP